MSRPAAVGVIGVGDIGAALAENALAAGWEVVLCDPAAEAVRGLRARGADVVDTAPALAARVPFVQVAVMDDAQVQAAVVGSGMLDALGRHTVVLIHSTVHPATIAAVQTAAGAAAPRILDAPVTDPTGSQGLRRRTANFLVGGAAAALERARPLLELSSARIFHLGASGRGAAAKLIRNLTMYGTLLAAFEARSLAAAAGIERELLLEILVASGAASDAMANYLRRTSYDPEYEAQLPRLVEIFRKDLQLALDLAGQYGLALPGVTLTRDRVEALLAPAGPAHQG